MDTVSWVVLACYAWLVFELTVVAVPSEASVYQLVTERADEDGEDALARARRRGFADKFVRFFLPTALGVLLFVVPPVAVFWPPLIDALVPVDLPHWAAFLGAGLLGIGRSITFTAAVQLRRRHDAHGEGLEPAGLFRRSRNPILVGMYVFYLGICCIFPCLVLWLGFVPYVWNMHQRVLMEESHLRHHLGPKYQEYVQDVPRYFLF